MSFKALLERFETLQKSLPAEGSEDDNKIAAAAAQSGDTPNGDGNGEGGEGVSAGEGGNDDIGDGEGEEPMGKSFSITLDDGTVIDAQDGTELVKALTEQVGALQGRLDAQASEGEVMAKALETACAVIEKQDAMFKSLAAKVDALSKQGRGRASVVNVAEKPAAAAVTKPAAEGVKPDEFMAKAMDKFNAGSITGRDVAIAENALAVGKPVPAELVSKVLS
jgi:hypothetical protein